MKDARIRRRPAEQQAIIDSEARCSCLSAANLGIVEMAERYLVNWDAIVQASPEAGPFLHSVRATEIVRLPIA